MTKIFSKIKASAKTIILIGVCLLIALAGTTLYAFNSVSKDIPEIKKIADYRPLAVTQIISLENGESKVMAEFYKERRYLTPYDQIPLKLVHAYISAEDSSFFEHQGINFVAIIRAAVANFLAGQVVQGGSTITQQIAKSLYLSPEKNILRKIKEFFLAFQLEKNLKKEEILYLYLNQIYLGSGAYGVQAAAHTYFHKDLKHLTTAEMALIAGLPTAPGKYSPLLNPKKAKERQMYVLKRMYENKYISEAEQKSAGAEKVRIYVNDGTEQKLAPHLVEHIRRYLMQKYDEKAVYEDGLTVVIPGALKNYEYASEALESGLEEEDQQKGYRGPIKNIPHADWDKEKDELKKTLAKEYFPYRHLTPDGRLDLESAIQDYDPNYEKTLSGKKVQALVTQISPDQKSATASIGLVSVELPLDWLRWATPANKPTRKINSVSEVLHPGDLVWVKVAGYSREGWKARLMQIPEIEGALYSVDAETGQILAMIGGYDYQTSEFNRAVQARRQVGSTFKPIIYSAALEHGYTPASIIVDSPIVFEDAENGVWKPENYEEKFYGDTTFRQALIESRNIPTIKIVQDIKVSTVINQAKRLGLEGPFNSDLSISLGSANVSLQEMVHAFTAFPLQGKPFHPVLFDKILDRDGRVLETGKDFSNHQDAEAAASPTATPREGEPNQYAPLLPGYRLDPRIAYLMTHLMKEVVEYGTAMSANTFGRPIAGKTGTTQDFRDAWFMGFSPRVVTGVWVGYDDQRSLGHGQSGAIVALPIWLKYMQNALKSYPVDDFPIPDGITFENIDPKSGKKSAAANSIKEAFIAGTEPGAKKVVGDEVEEPKIKGPKKTGPLKMDDNDNDSLREDN